MANHDYVLGVDGGGTGCRARLADRRGRVLGEGRSGPANLMLGADVAWRAVLEAARGALAQAGLGEDALARTRAGLGLASANVPAQRDAFLAAAPRPLAGLAGLAIASDAEAACLGAHGGRDGAVLILGTGSQGVLHRGGRFEAVGGWGFAVSDDGSGALLGRAALRYALLAHEGMAPASALTAALMRRFDDAPPAVVAWAARARPADWGGLARPVVEHAEAGDAVACALMQSGAGDAAVLVDRLLALGAGRVALMGGLAQPSRRWLPERLAPRLCEPEGDAMDGALLLAARAGDVAG